MKFDRLQLAGTGLTSVNLPLYGADPAGPFILKGVDGLGAPEVIVRLDRTVLEKAVDQGKSANLRQVIMLVGLQPNWDEGQTADELRDMLYPFLTPRYGGMMTLNIILAGAIQAYARGHISKMEPAIFSKDPAVQITMNCDYPYLLKNSTTKVAPANTLVGGKRSFDIENPGNAPSGFIASFVLGGALASPLILSDSNPSGQKIQIDGIDWLSGDKFRVDTRPGSRGVWRATGGGGYASILKNLNGAVSEWMYLYNGTNTLNLNTSSAFTWDSSTDFSFVPAFWGV